MSGDLFGVDAPGLTQLPGFVRAGEAGLLHTALAVAAQAPFRVMETPGGKAMSAALTNCGHHGWVSDRRGYRYTTLDPLTGKPWPDMPEIFRKLAADAAARAGFPGFAPDACLINRYAPGARMSLHQDLDETDFSAPIVSVSLGLPAIFLWGGMARGGRTVKVPLESGDVVVWGGPARMNFHGVAPVREGSHPLTGRARINLTLRKTL